MDESSRYMSECERSGQMGCCGVSCNVFADGRCRNAVDVFQRDYDVEEQALLLAHRRLQNLTPLELAREPVYVANSQRDCDPKEQALLPVVHEGGTLRAGRYWAVQRRSDGQLLSRRGWAHADCTIEGALCATYDGARALSELAGAERVDIVPVDIVL